MELDAVWRNPRLTVQEVEEPDPRHGERRIRGLERGRRRIGRVELRTRRGNR